MQFHWEPGEGQHLGELRSVATVQSEGMSGTNVADVYHGTLMFGGRHSADRGGFQLRHSHDGGLAGFWRLPGETNLQPVHFLKIAAMEKRSRSTRLRFLDYGLSKEATVVWPRFLGGDPLLRAVNGWLESAAIARMEPPLEWTRDELEGIWRWPNQGASGEWHWEARWELVWRTNHLVSLLEHHSSYTGGAHGNYGQRGANFQWIGGRLRELVLPDFFRPDSGWRRTLAKLVVDDLRRQKASGCEGIDPERAAGFNFTFDAQGMQFHFDPYEVGSYAEGSFTVHVPWEQLSPFLPTNGMVRLRPTGIRPALPRSGG